MGEIVQRKDGNIDAMVTKNPWFYKKSFWKTLSTCSEYQYLIQIFDWTLTLITGFELGLLYLILEGSLIVCDISKIYLVGYFRMRKQMKFVWNDTDVCGQNR